jgi:hypothetical protein
MKDQWFVCRPSVREIEREKETERFYSLSLIKVIALVLSLLLSVSGM